MTTSNKTVSKKTAVTKKGTKEAKSRRSAEAGIPIKASGKKGKYEPGDFNLKVKRSFTGLGLFAGEDIKKGSCIIEYRGPTLTKQQEEDSNSLYLFEVTKSKTIDGSVRWNTARYINHSCRPNSEIDIYKERVFVMAKRNIKAGEELNYDYDTDYYEAYIKPKGCKCIKHAPELWVKK